MARTVTDELHHRIEGETGKTRNQKQRPKRDNAYGRIQGHSIATRANYYLNSILMSNIWPKLCGRFLRFVIFPPQLCECYGAIYRRNYEISSAL